MSTPTSLTGYLDDGVLGLDGFGSIVDYLLEQTLELTHPMSVRTYAKMRTDPQLAAILKAYVLAIGRGSWALDGSGCRDEVTQRIADDLGLPIAGTEQDPTGARRRGFTWAKHLQTAVALKLTFGHAPFAQQWNLEAGQFRLGMVQERMPQTIAAIHLNPDGTLAWAEQHGTTGQTHAPKITTADHQLVWYAHDREGSNYYGASMLRPSYGPWLIKDQMLRVHATSIRRFGMGIPTMEAPAGATPQQIGEAQRIASQVKASENAGMAVPNGFKYSLAGMTGNVPDALAFIAYLDQQMTRSTLTSILDMAAAQKGNRSLGETVMDLMVYAQQAEANTLAEEGTTQIVVPLVDANWGESEPAPQIVCTDVGADVELTAQDMNWLLQYAGLVPDAPFRAHVRQRYGIPDEDLATVLAVPGAPSTDPNAPPTPTEGA